MTIQGASGSSAYGGFSAPEPPAQPRAYERRDTPPPQPRMYEAPDARTQGPGRRRTAVVVTGVLTALALGGGVGLLSRVDLRPAPEPPPPPDVSALNDGPAAPAPATTRGLVTPEEVARIALGEDAPAKSTGGATPAPKVSTPAARPVIVAQAKAPPVVRRVAPAPTARQLAVATPAPVVVHPPAPVVRAPAPAPQLAAAPERNFRPAFHCDWRLRPSEAMVCADPQLAAYDRELNRAFRLAVEAGAPRAWLREEQDEWVMVDRERAARRGGPDAVAEAYRRRIAELRDLYD